MATDIIPEVWEARELLLKNPNIYTTLGGTESKFPDDEPGFIKVEFPVPDPRAFEFEGMENATIEGLYEEWDREKSFLMEEKDFHEWLEILDEDDINNVKNDYCVASIGFTLNYQEFLETYLLYCCSYIEKALGTTFEHKVYFDDVSYHKHEIGAYMHEDDWALLDTEEVRNSELYKRHVESNPMWTRDAHSYAVISYWFYKFISEQPGYQDYFEEGQVFNLDEMYSYIIEYMLNDGKIFLDITNEYCFHLTRNSPYLRRVRD